MNKISGIASHLTSVAPVKTILGTMTFGSQATVQVASEQLRVFQEKGHFEIDTARMYNHGKTEEILGEIMGNEANSNFCLGFQVSSKVNPFKTYNENLTPESIRLQSTEILGALKMPSTDILYLHAPDISTPIEETLSAMQELYVAGKFRRFGLSNYAAWEVVYIWSYCKEQGWVLPSVYQGMYNAITRDVEKELFPALRKLGISFYAYNPLCGGLLTGKYSSENCVPEETEGLRFDISNKLYRDRYWKSNYFEALEIVRQACIISNLGMADCGIRWLVHHSQLQGELGDGLIVGASSVQHLISNLNSCDSGPLPSTVVEAFDQAWDVTRPVCEKYFRP